MQIGVPPSLYGRQFAHAKLLSHGAAPIPSANEKGAAGYSPKEGLRQPANEDWPTDSHYNGSPPSVRPIRGKCRSFLLGPTLGRTTSSKLSPRILPPPGPSGNGPHDRVLKCHCGRFLCPTAFPRRFFTVCVGEPHAINGVISQKRRPAPDGAFVGSPGRRESVSAPVWASSTPWGIFS